jgi:hypothetical protein
VRSTVTVSLSTVSKEGEEKEEEGSRVRGVYVVYTVASAGLCAAVLSRAVSRPAVLGHTSSVVRENVRNAQYVVLLLFAIRSHTTITITLSPSRRPPPSPTTLTLTTTTPPLSSHHHTAELTAGVRHLSTPPWQPPAIALASGPTACAATATLSVCCPTCRRRWRRIPWRR